MDGGDRRYLAATGALLMTLSSLLAGCHLPISTEVLYKPEAPTREPLRAPAKNDLRLGIRTLELHVQGGGEPDPEVGDARDLGLRLAEAVRDTLLFKEVHYPLRDEEVDVILEPTLEVALAKNGCTNALKVLGIVLPWIDGLGFDYDYEVELALAVVNPARPDERCAVLQGRCAMTAERYPSILWFLGLHVGLFILMVLESATTDQAVLEHLVELTTDEAMAPALSELMERFAPVARPCPLHPEEQQVGRYCVVCGRDLFYPVLRLREAKRP